MHGFSQENFYSLLLMGISHQTQTYILWKKSKNLSDSFDYTIDTEHWAQSREKRERERASKRQQLYVKGCLKLRAVIASCARLSLSLSSCSHSRAFIQCQSYSSWLRVVFTSIVEFVSLLLEIYSDIYMHDIRHCAVQLRRRQSKQV